MTTNAYMTPIFNELEVEQGVEMPLPPLETHEEFLLRHQHAQFLDRAEAILNGSVEDLAPTPGPELSDLFPQKPVKKPVKKAAKRAPAKKTSSAKAD